jgi:hypothetical protein
MPAPLFARGALLTFLCAGVGCSDLPNSERDISEDASSDDTDAQVEVEVSADAGRDARVRDARSDMLDADNKASEGGKAQAEIDAAVDTDATQLPDTGPTGPCSGGQTRDCEGVCGGSAKVDDCNVCNGNNASKDCAGACGGSAREDCSGMCNGPDQPKTYYRDSDADNLGDPKVSQALCAAAAGMVSNSDDCDDTKKGVCAPSDVLRYKAKITASAALPWNQLAMVGLGDVDGDMVPDLAVTNVSASAPTSSVSIVFLNANGSLKGSRRLTTADFGTPTPALTPGLGFSLAAVGDIDGDMVPDLAVGEPNASQQTSLTDFGRVWLLFLNNTGAVKARAQVLPPSAPPTAVITLAAGVCQGAPVRWGDKLASFDLDLDGRLELAVATQRDCRNTSTRVTGRIELYRLAANRTVAAVSASSRVLWDAAPYADEEFFDATLTAAGDADGDGVGDLNVVTPTNKVWTLLLTATGTVKDRARLTAVSAANPALGSLTRSFGALPGTPPRVLINLPTLTTRGGFAATRAPSSSATTPPYRVFYPKEIGIEAQVAASTGFGQSGTSLGDLERDGLPEVLVTAPGDDSAGADLGAAFVLGFAATCDNQTLRGDCNASAADGCETALTSTDSCGACGRSCTGAPNSTAGSCSNEGKCVLTCATNFGDCNGDVRDGCETDLRTNLQHCGMCGNACPVTKHRLPSCSANTCGSLNTCETGWADCNTNLATDGCEACGKCGQEQGGSAPAGIAPPAAPCLPDQICRRQTWRASSGQTGEFEYFSCLTQCPVGRGDCNNLPADGCEANLTLQTRCGSCSTNAVCGVWGWLEYCVLNDQGTQYQCTN